MKLLFPHKHNECSRSLSLDSICWFVVLSKEQISTLRVFFYVFSVGVERQFGRKNKVGGAHVTINRQLTSLHFIRARTHHFLISGCLFSPRILKWKQNENEKHAGWREEQKTTTTLWISFYVNWRAENNSKEKNMLLAKDTCTFENGCGTLKEGASHYETQKLNQLNCGEKEWEKKTHTKRTINK